MKATVTNQQVKRPVGRPKKMEMIVQDLEKQDNDHENYNRSTAPEPEMNDEHENDDQPAQTVDQVIDDVHRRGFGDMLWWFDIPKKERFHPGDVIYSVELDRFGIFISPARKSNLVRIRLLKVGTKVDVYTRDWFVQFDSLMLVKRNDTMKRGFAETDQKYIRRAGKISRHIHYSSSQTQASE